MTNSTMIPAGKYKLKKQNRYVQEYNIPKRILKGKSKKDKMMYFPNDNVFFENDYFGNSINPCFG